MAERILDREEERPKSDRQKKLKGVKIAEFAV